MIRVSVFYPTQEGSKFDWNYYVNTHMPLVREKFGIDLVKDEIDRGLSSAESDSPAPFQIIVHLWFNSMENVKNAMGKHGPDLTSDIPNYTDVIPIFQISEIAIR
ncbi:EthD family reductase [SAR202 cluster bacterium AD-804-J14_MRT_500m]|nr:EthD family reductase [SAR202 cluster bacterium AD-804-J14_MRT_500m]